jgi:hypothetical protein
MIPVKLTKKYIFDRNIVNVYYRIRNISEKSLHTVFSPELNLSFSSPAKENLQLSVLKGGKRSSLYTGSATVNHTREIVCEDVFNSNEITISTDIDGGLWSFPLETHCLDGHKIIKEYQAACFVMMWEINLAQEETWENRISLRIDG